MIDAPPDADLADIELAVNTCMRPAAAETRSLIAEVRELRAERLALRHALEFYARGRTLYYEQFDLGLLARLALAGVAGEGITETGSATP